jgi:two-component system phosphate regulon sensor histidine kinase PhoR
MRLHFGWRRVVPFLILVAVAVTVFGFSSQHLIRREHEALWKAHFENIARLIATEADDFYGGPSETINLNRIANQYADTLGVDIVFLRSDGAVLGASSTAIPYRPEPDDVEAMLAGEGAYTAITDQGMTIITEVTGANGRLLGFVQMQAPSEMIQPGFTSLWGLWASVILITTLLAVILSVIIYDHSLRPVEKLTIAAQQMRSGNFYNLEFPEAPPELSDLNQAIREMAQHLGAQIDALTSERAKLSAVLNQMTDGVLIADMEGRVQLLNPAAERLFEIDAHKGLGRSVVEVVRYHQLVELWRAAREGQRQATMLEIGPQHLFLQVTGMPLETTEKGSTLILFQDLTQLRRLETVRRDFISNVSHELRTPLASLKALSETLQEGALEDPPAARRFLLRMETEIDNLTQLVNELLELSRIESGKVPLSFHRIQPCGLLVPASERMELQVARAGLELVLECPPGLPAVFADPDRITQVVINLIHNAIKFTPPGGRIERSAYRDGEFVVLFVKDTGVGIPKEDLGRVFERFYKADRARTGGGTGLGLSIARHMVESHGGFIWAESEEGVGSTFYFSLPIA